MWRKQKLNAECGVKILKREIELLLCSSELGNKSRKKNKKTNWNELVRIDANRIVHISVQIPNKKNAILIYSSRWKKMSQKKKQKNVLASENVERPFIVRILENLNFASNNNKNPLWKIASHSMAPLTIHHACACKQFDT